MTKRYCKQCGKELVKNKRKHRQSKRGWVWESPSQFLNRNFCKKSCCSLYNQIKLGHTHWTKELILKEFNQIKTDKKWKWEYMAKKHSAMANAITRYYKKNAWCKFIIEQGHHPLSNFVNQKYKIRSKLLLKYWREEDVTNGIGKIFSYSLNYGIPGTNQNTRNIHRALQYLIKLKSIRIYKKGIPGYKVPTQYVLLKSRI